MVCSLPSSVLLLTGYWPVIGESIAICVSGGPTVLLVPEDEAELAEAGFADFIETFVPESLTEMRSVSAAVKLRLAEIFHELNITSGSIGFECGARSQASSYLAMHLFGNSLSDMLRELLPGSSLTPIDEWLRKLSSVKTKYQLEKIRQACAIAKKAFESGASQLRAGMDEPEAAQVFRAPLCTTESPGRPMHRHDGFAFCMSGPNSAKACAAYARTRHRRLQSQDLVMIHCNSYVDGFWTDTVMLKIC